MAAPKKNVKPAELDPNAYDGQLLLLDMFLGNVRFSQKLSTKPNRRLSKYEKNVPLANFSNINQIMNLNMSAVNDFIHSLTPLEYAQIYPSIGLSIIDSTNDQFKPVPLPISDPNDINNNKLTQGAGYYSTNSFGLRSLEMYLDGSDHPFFSKAYLVNMEFIFDSINTFTGDIPGLPGISYARLLKSSGRVGESNFALKMDIGYGSNNKGLVEKYDLHSPSMGFSLFLNFLKSTVSIEENLKVSVKADYISREEQIFSSVQLYDILAIDVGAAQKKQENIIDANRLKRAALDLAANKALAATKAAIASEAQTLRAQIPALEKQFNAAVTERDRQIENARKRRLPVDTTSLQLKIQGLEKTIIAKEDALENRESLLKNNNYEDLLKESGFSDTATQIKERLDDQDQKAFKKLKNARRDQIIESLDELFNSAYNAKAVKEIKVTQRDLIKYYGQAIRQTRTKLQLKATQKNLNSATSANTTGSGASSAVSTQGQVNMGGSTGGQAGTFEARMQTWQEEMKNASTIQYILLGDLVRLIFEKLLKNTAVHAKKAKGSKKAKNLSNIQAIIKKNLEKGVILLPNVEIDSLETNEVYNRNLYYLPISIRHLRLIFANEVWGKNRTSFTLFDLMDKIANLLSLTRKRKEQVLNVQTSNSSFRLKKRTYPIERDRGAEKIASSARAMQASYGSYGKKGILFGNKTKKINPAVKSFVSAAAGAPKIKYKIFTDHPNYLDQGRINSYRYGIVLNIEKFNQKSVASANVPTFIFGGSPTGIIKKFNLNEYTDDDLQKLVMEETTGNADVVIPSMYSVSITTVMCPIFQLGMDIQVLTPTINVYRDKLNIFIEGTYAVKKIIHSYKGNSFTTTIEGMMKSEPSRIIDSALNRIDNKNALVEAAANSIFQAYEPDIKKLSTRSVGEAGKTATTTQGNQAIERAELIVGALGTLETK